MADYNFTIVDEEVNIEVAITENINNFGENAGVDLSAYQKTADADLKYAVKNHTHAYSELTGLPTLFSGNYNDLSEKPTIPSAQVNSDWNATSGVQQILNKPTLFSGSYADLTDKPSTFAPSTHTHAISEVTGLQTELNGKAASTHKHNSIIQTNGNTALQFWKGTQAQYDAIATKNSNTIYFIV